MPDDMRKAAEKLFPSLNARDDVYLAAAELLDKTLKQKKDEMK
jgi:hypothetical protein